MCFVLLVYVVAPTLNEIDSLDNVIFASLSEETYADDVFVCCD